VPRYIIGYSFELLNHLMEFALARRGLQICTKYTKAIKMADVPEVLRNGYVGATSLADEKLEQLATDLGSVDAPRYMIERIEGLLCERRSNFADASQKLLNVFTETQYLPILNEFFWPFSRIISQVPEQTFWSVINLFLDVIDSLYKNNKDPEEKARFNTFFAFFVYHAPGSIEVKKSIARKWLELVGVESIRTELMGFLSGPDAVLPVSTVRFFAYILACVGLEDEVIGVNTIVAENSKQEDFLTKLTAFSAEGYAASGIFRNSTDFFCDLLLDFNDFGNVLDIGCGPGRIGENIRDQCQSLTGIELKPEYADFARTQSRYDEVIEGDAVTEIAKLSSTYDFITSCMALDYFPAQAVIHDAAKLLNPGGCLAFSFIPAEKDAENVLAHAYHYERDFYKKAAPDLSVVKCVMEPYMWTGGYYVLLKRDH